MELIIIPAVIVVVFYLILLSTQEIYERMSKKKQEIIIKNSMSIQNRFGQYIPLLADTQFWGYTGTAPIIEFEEELIAMFGKT